MTGWKRIPRPQNRQLAPCRSQDTQALKPSRPPLRMVRKPPRFIEGVVPHRERSGQSAVVYAQPQEPNRTSITFSDCIGDWSCEEGAIPEGRGLTDSCGISLGSSAAPGHDSEKYPSPERAKHRRVRLLCPSRGSNTASTVAPGRRCMAGTISLDFGWCFAAPVGRRRTWVSSGQDASRSARDDAAGFRLRDGGAESLEDPRDRFSQDPCGVCVLRTRSDLASGQTSPTK